MSTLLAHPCAPRGKFIVLEGPDGSGKTTAAAYLTRALNAAGAHTVQTHEVGGTAVGASLRKLIFSPPEDETIDPVARLLMALASRIQNIRTNIEPLLDKGINVVCDRFSLSTQVYQGRIDKLNFMLTDLENIQEMRFAALRPDHLLFFDVSVQTAMARAAARPGTDNTHYKNDLAKTKAVIEHYRECVGRNSREGTGGKTLTRIDANAALEMVQGELDRFVKTFMRPLTAVLA